LNVGGISFFAPVSSFNKPQQSNYVIKDANGHSVSSLRFSYMIPVPQGAVTLKDIDNEEPQYKNLLNIELQDINKHVNAILTRARYVYDMVVIKKNPLMVKNCCDFKALEAACAEYERLTEQQLQPETSVGAGIIKTSDGQASVTKTIRAAQKDKRPPSPSPSKSKCKDETEL